MRFSEVGTPVASSDGEDRQLGDDDGSTNCGCDFFGGLDTKANVPFAIADDHNGLESSTLTSTGLLLNGLDLFIWLVCASALPTELIVPS